MFTLLFHQLLALIGHNCVYSHYLFTRLCLAAGIPEWLHECKSWKNRVTCQLLLQVGYFFHLGLGVAGIRLRVTFIGFLSSIHQLFAFFHQS